MMIETDSGLKSSCVVIEEEDHKFTIDTTGKPMLP